MNHFFLTPPRWRPIQQWTGLAMPDAARAWLTEPGSLTARLKAAFPDGFRVQVLGQRWAVPFPADARRLGLRRGRRALIREVQLVCSEGVLICARTTIPPRTLHGLKRLARVGSRSLGEVIFSYPDLRRVGLDVARIEPTSMQALVQSELGQSDVLWGRRNAYDIAGRTFLVSEYFYPRVIDSR